jgi:hypothetical protein
MATEDDVPTEKPKAPQMARGEREREKKARGDEKQDSVFGCTRQQQRIT